MLGAEDLVQSLRLRDRAGKSIEDEAARGIRLVDPVGDEADDDRVRDEFTFAHDRLGLNPDRRPAL